METCYFKQFDKCSTKNTDIELTVAGCERIKSIIAASKERGDELHTDLEVALERDNNHTITCHRNCVSTYCSKLKIQRLLKSRARSSSEPPPAKRTRRKTSTEFSFQTHCIFCGEECIEEKDPKHPNRWRAVSRCRTVESLNKKSLREAILHACQERNDVWAEEVELRIQGAFSDLHAADARYHNDCKPAFMAPKSVQQAQDSVRPADKDSAFSEVIKIMQSDTDRLWSSVELHNLYTEKSGTELQRRRLVEEISYYFGEKILILSCTGLASLLVFRSRASQLVNLVENSDNDSSNLKAIAKQIISESKSIAQDPTCYNSGIDKADVQSQCSETLLSLLSKLSPSLDGSLGALLIGNMITSVITHKPTTLQIALGVVLQEKHLINTFYDYLVTCSYDEVLRFKSSAAKYTSENTRIHGLFDASDGLIQTVIDNYDANIASLNGLQSTHALAMLLCQNGQANNSGTGFDYTFPRITKKEMSQPLDDPVPLHMYHGPKHPDMIQLPPGNAEDHDQIEQHATVSVSRARELDVGFLKTVVASDNACEYGGFLTKTARDQHHTIKPATAVQYRPLLDMKPSDPSTVKTALVEAQVLSERCGQEFVVITADQQIYKVIVDNVWAEPTLFSNIYPRLGGMHSIMSFCGCIGKLMVDSGLSELLKHAFGGVEKMLTGKKYPQNVRAFRLLTEELLREQIINISTYDELEDFLINVSDRSPTAKLWVDCFVRPCLVLMAFIRAERESDWPLHLWSYSQMIPYFFAAGHANYARYGLYYLRSMESLPSEIQKLFMKGQHTMRHTPGSANSTWSDMFIETTFMRYGHSHGGLTGITLNDSATRRWALSLHTCSQIIRDITSMRDAISDNTNHHKEETKARMQSDAADRNKLREKLGQCIHPFNPVGHPPALFNIVSGKLADVSVNVQNALQIGQQSMHTYEEKLPEGFYSAISSPVIYMSNRRKHVQVGPVMTYDTDFIFNRTLGLLASGDIDLQNLFSYELAPIPTSLFMEDGGLRPATAKSKLKNCLQVEHSSRTLTRADVVVVDGCAILWTIQWPNGTVKDLVMSVARYISPKLKNSDVYLIFDRYHDYSPKGCTRGNRALAGAPQLHFSLSSSLPPQSTSLTITGNKAQIIELICCNLPSEFVKDPYNHSLLITGPNSVPTEICRGLQIQRRDMEIKHEEADTIIINQVVSAAEQGNDHIHVISDDTDVFVLLLHYYKCLNLACHIMMVPTSSKRSVVNIGATVEKHSGSVPHLLSMHALTGCDTVSTIHGIGKVKALNILNKGHIPPPLGEHHTDMDTLIKGAISFIAACYGSKYHDSMSQVRFNVWQFRTGRRQARSFKLPTLPPTSEAFELHVKRAHHQARIWRDALEPGLPTLPPTEYGWMADHSTKSLIPVPLPVDTLTAPAEVLSLLRCSCSTDDPCSSKRCSCHKSGLTCSIFCQCSISPTAICHNPLKFECDEESGEDDEPENAEVFIDAE